MAVVCLVSILAFLRLTATFVTPSILTGNVCVQGHVFSSSSQLIGLELSEEFVKLQNDIVQKYQLTDRVKVHIHRVQCVMLFFIARRCQQCASPPAGSTH